MPNFISAQDPPSGQVHQGVRLELPIGQIHAGKKPRNESYFDGARDSFEDAKFTNEPIKYSIQAHFLRYYAFVFS